MENGNSEVSFQVPKIDFSGLDLSSSHGGSRWEAVRAQVVDAIETHGFFEAVLDHAKLPPELLTEVFDETLGELFSVPADNKLQLLASNFYYESYIPSPTFEVIIVKEPALLESVQTFASLMWPQQGNPRFCDKIWGISKALAEVDLMVLRMILEGLGVGQHYESLVKSTKQMIRLAGYKPQETEMINMGEHTDMNVISIVYQHDEQGLEILTPDGRWLQPPPNSFTVLMGETMMALTNGKLKPNLHRVRRAKNETARYSIGFSSHFREGFVIDALEEFVDEEHPKLFKPYDYPSYMKFRVTDAGRASSDALRDYCGVESDNVAAASLDV